VQAVLGWLLGIYLKLILRTVRWRHENLADVEPVLTRPGGAIGAFWHGRVPICLGIWPQWERKPTSALISPSRDGEFIARALAMSRCGAIRISSARKGDAAKSRAAVAAFREAVDWVTGGGALIVTPDGPRGPNEEIAPGLMQIARRSGAPVFLLGIAASPAWQFGTWDKVMVALPFGRGVVVWDGPHTAPPHASEAEVARLTEDWAERLTAATRRAEALAQGRLRSGDLRRAVEPRPAALALYHAAAGRLAPLGPAVLARRARRGKEDPARVGERLGRASEPRPKGSLIWLHAVSVGESVSLLPLIGCLAADRTDLTLLVTSTTRTSAEILQRRLPPGAIHQYAPIDTPAAVAGFLDHWRPDVGLFAESELWPNLILAAQARGTRLALVSARMTKKSAKNWSAQPAAARTMLQAFELILAQDAATEARLAKLGGRVAGRLNLKRVGAPLAADPAEAAALAEAIGGRPAIVAISTHAGEEKLIADVAAGLPGRPLLILAPRHRERGDAVAAELAGRRLARRSTGEPLTADTSIYLADTLGEIGLLLSVADIAVVGGSFGRAIGGHNPLEPARLGVPAVTGPDVFNFAELYAEMEQAGAAVAVRDGAGLKAALGALLADPARRRRMGEAARAFADRQAGELEAGLALIRPLLPPPAT